MIEYGADTKKFPKKYKKMLEDKTMLMIFTKPSLRTRISFQRAMFDMSGHAIDYILPADDMKRDSIKDIAKTTSRYADCIMARLHEHKDMIELAENASVPVINGLTNFNHPCQALSDMLTIKENKGKLKGIRLVYVGDAKNNMTHSLMFVCAKLGLKMTVCCPRSMMPNKRVIDACKDISKRTKGSIMLKNSTKGIEGADVVYTDTWMSYHIPQSQKKKRFSALKNFRVTKALMSRAGKKAIFMHCLPAQRGVEVDQDVIDGPQSVVYDQAENRLHVQKAILLKVFGKR